MQKSFFHFFTTLKKKFSFRKSSSDDWDDEAPPPLPPEESFHEDWEDQDQAEDFFDQAHQIPWWKKIFSFSKKKDLLPEPEHDAGDKNSTPPVVQSHYTNSSLPQFLFSPQNRGRLHRIFLVLLILAGTYTLGKILGLLLGDKKDSGRNVIPQSAILLTPPLLIQDFSIIRTANLFDARKEVPKVLEPEVNPAVDENLICTAASAKSSLPFSLHDTIVLQDSVKSIASVQIRDLNDLERYREGDKIKDLAKIGKIERLRIIVKNLKTGRCEFVLSNDALPAVAKEMQVLSPAAGKSLMEERKKMGIANEGNNFKIPKKLLDEKLKDLPGILSQARALKIDNPDGSMCFKITELEPGGIFAFLGIQDDDIICGINGNKITNMNQVMNLFGQLGQLSKLDLTVNRAGQESRFNYQLAQ